MKPMRIALIVLSCCLPLLVFSQKTKTKTTTYYDITEFGAVEGGEQLCTKAIQQAIDECSANGGGMVYVPAGTFLTGTLTLKSNINLHIESGATLLGSTNMNDYDSKHPHLIYAKGVTNFSLTGRGTIDGQGLHFFNRTGTNWQPKQPRPAPWIMIQDGKRIEIEDVLLTNTPSNALVLVFCEAVVIDGITVNNEKLSPGTNGIDINNCKMVQINNCFIQTGGDAISLQSKTSPVEQVVVTNCILSSDDAAVNFGTASAMAIRNCIFSNLSIYDTRYGISLIMVDGGIFEHNIFENMVINTNSRHAVEYPIFIDIHKRDGASKLGQINKLLFKNISIITEGNILIGGQKNAPIRQLDFENVTMTVKGVTSLARASKPTIELVGGAAAGLEDFSTMPALFTIAHTENLTLSNVKFFFEFEQAPRLDRHAFYFNNAHHVLIDRFTGRQVQDEGQLATILCVNSSDFNIVNSTAAAGTYQFLSQQQSRDITMNATGNNLRSAKVQN